MTLLRLHDIRLGWIGWRKVNRLNSSKQQTNKQQANVSYRNIERSISKILEHRRITIKETGVILHAIGATSQGFLFTNCEERCQRKLHCLSTKRQIGQSWKIKKLSSTKIFTHREKAKLAIRTKRRLPQIH